MTITLDVLNQATAKDFTQILHGIYEHSPWVPERAAAQRPFKTLAALKLSMQAVVSKASEDEQLTLIRAHPELAGKAAIAGTLTKESTGEQSQAGLQTCSPQEFALLNELNAAYNAKFGFPFILAVKGPQGEGISREEIISTFTRRLKNQRADELAECLRQISRIAELRLNALFAHVPQLGNDIMAWSETIAAWSDEQDALTCAYMTEAHCKTASQLASWMREAGMLSRDRCGR